MTIAHANPFRYLTVTVVYGRVAGQHKAQELADRFRPFATWTAASFGEGERVEIVLHTGETVTVTYAEATRYLPPAAGTFPVQRLTSTARLPERGSKDAAGLDLFYDGPDVKFIIGESRLMSTGIALTCPPGTYARVAPRSGLSVKGFDVGAGVVDRDYTGEIKVLLTRRRGIVDAPCPTLHLIAHGDRIAQLIFESIVMAEPVDTVALSSSDRGSGGFGSTGN